MHERNDAALYQHSPLGKELLIVGHTYQPHREPHLPSSGKRLDMLPFVNDMINSQVYSPIFELTERSSEGKEYGVPEGIFSYWAPLRDWKMAHDPEGFAKAKDNINALEDKEYKILSDTYMHLIMPLQDEQDQRMMTEIGFQAFVDDFGFEPKGVWLAETGIDRTTLRILKEKYEFVVLRDTQIESAEQNPMYASVRNNDGEIEGEMAVIHFNSALSGAVSFQDEITVNADTFLEDQKNWAPGDISIGSDTELYGHHKKGREWWRRYVTRPEVLKAHNFAIFDVKDRLSSPNHMTTELRDKTSWSCEHGLGRWTGECGCDNPSPEAIADKKEFYNTLTNYGLAINTLLDEKDLKWRESFVPFFLGVRSSWFGAGNVEYDIQALRESSMPVAKALSDPGMLTLFKAKMCELTGKTSCGWFFGNTTSPERELPRTMIREIETLVPEIHHQEKTVFQASA